VIEWNIFSVVIEADYDQYFMVVIAAEWIVFLMVVNAESEW